MSTLSQQLSILQKQLNANPNMETASQIVSEYFDFFGNEKPLEDLWLLTIGALTNDEVHQTQNAKDRYNLIFFYEFTKLFVEAAAVLNGKSQTKQDE